MSVEKRYLGGAVYAEVDGLNDLVLTTEDGNTITNKIYLEPPTWAALKDYVEAAEKEGDE